MEQPLSSAPDGSVDAHRKLVVWQDSMALCEALCRATDRFPDDERFRLTDQLRRAALSVPSNIAEGKGRQSSRSLLNHLRIASGSLAEIDTHLELAKRLSYITDAKFALLNLQRIDCVRLIRAMIRGVQRNIESDAARKKANAPKRGSRQSPARASTPSSADPRRLTPDS